MCHEPRQLCNISWWHDKDQWSKNSVLAVCHPVVPHMSATTLQLYFFFSSQPHNRVITCRKHVWVSHKTRTKVCGIQYRNSYCIIRFHGHLYEQNILNTVDEFSWSFVASYKVKQDSHELLFVDTTRKSEVSLREFNPQTTQTSLLPGTVLVVFTV